MEKINTGVEQRAAKATLSVIIENEMNFKLPEDFKHKVESFNRQKNPFTDNQLSYIDGFYEKYMNYGGLPSVKVKHDFRKRR